MRFFTSSFFPNPLPPAPGLTPVNVFFRNLRIYLLLKLGYTTVVREKNFYTERFSYYSLFFLYTTDLIWSRSWEFLASLAADYPFLYNCWHWAYRSILTVTEISFYISLNGNIFSHGLTVYHIPRLGGAKMLCAQCVIRHQQIIIKIDLRPGWGVCLQLQ